MKLCIKIYFQSIFVEFLTKMKPDSKGKRKGGKKRPITDGVLGLKSNGDVSAAGSSGSISNGMIF